MEQVNTNNEIIRGYCMHRRWRSKKILFYDLATDTSDEAVKKSFQLILKYPDLSVEQIEEYRRIICLGDFLEVNGINENSENEVPVYVVKEIHVIQALSSMEEKLKYQVEKCFNNWNNLKLTTKTIPVCKLWWKNQCNNEKCSFRHYFQDEKEETHFRQLSERREKDQEKEMDHEDKTETKEQHSKRALVFVEWLVETFGIEHLNSGTGVLDIAGGKGHISFQLMQKYKINCTVIDPVREPIFSQLTLKRTLQLEKYRKKFLLKNPEHPAKLNHIQALFDNDFAKSEEGSKLLKSCSILIGMHPDEATEYIIDIAIQFGKQFAVVPCCVFPRIFTQRKLNGAPVITYQQLIEYLSLKSTEIHSMHLSFQGRNKVLFKIKK